MQVSLRQTRLLVGPLLSIALLHSSNARADNPIVQTLYTADPAPIVHDETVYVFTGHDEDTLVKDFFTMNDWRVYSSKDMVNWTDHGCPLKYKDFSWSSGDAWAGQVIARNGKFYYYIPTNRNGGKVLGVAVADSIIGPYKDAIGKPLVTSDCGDIDPTAFIDDDGQAYLYWGNPNLCYVKLNSDMVSYSGSVVKVPMTTASFGVRSKTDRPTTYEEGPWFYKRDGRYYMVFAAGPISEHIGYATSAGPTGPWVYGGVVMASEGASFTNHPGVIDYKGKSYFFYHNGALTGGSGYHRSVAVEEFTYGADGTIPKLKMTTPGPAAVATLNPYDVVEAETIAWESGIETEPCQEGGIDVTAIGNGDYIKVENVDFGSGATSFSARVAAASAGSTLEIRLDSKTGTLVGSCAIAATGGAQTWATKTCTVSGASGVHDLFFVFTGTGTFNFNNWQFAGTGGGTAAGGSGAAGAAVAGAPSNGGLGNSGGAGGGGRIASVSGAPSTRSGAAGASTAGGRLGVGGTSASSVSRDPAGASNRGGSAVVGGATSTSAATSVPSQGGAKDTSTSAGVSATPNSGGSVGSSSGTKGAGSVQGGGGASVGVGGNPATHSDSSSPNTGEPASESGCGCRLSDGASNSSPAAMLGLLSLLALRRGRRRVNDCAR